MKRWAVTEDGWTMEVLSYSDATVLADEMSYAEMKEMATAKLKRGGFLDTILDIAISRWREGVEFSEQKA